MPLIKIPKDVLDKETIVIGECTHPAGHCYGSDGGSGIPENLKVAPGRGGEVEVWALDNLKEKVEKQEIYEKCQYCLKLNYVRDKEN